MYRIDRQDWGYKLTFGGFVSQAEMKKWVEESRLALAQADGPFVVYVDMRSLKPLAPEVQEIMVGGQQLYQRAGMVRSAVLVPSVTTAMQFKRLAKESGIYEWERYFSGQAEDHEERAMAWLRDGADPDA